MSQHPYNTRNHPVQNNDVPPTSNQDKNNSIPKNSNINEESIPKLEYDVIVYLKKLKANISVYELLKIPAIQNQALQTLTGGKTPKGKVISTLEHSTSNKTKIVAKTREGNSQKTIQVTSESIGKKSTPPFLLTFEIFN